MHRAIFLDKDGTLVKDVPYNVDPEQIVLTPGALDGLQALQSAGFRLIVISNQSGVARGYFEEEDLLPVRARLQELLGQAGVQLDGFYYCPHHVEGTVPAYSVSCFCRKPSPGLIFRAAREHQVELERSWFVGDILNDVEAGHRAGCRTVLIDNGNETEWVPGPLREPDETVSDLRSAAEAILAYEEVLVG